MRILDPADILRIIQAAIAPVVLISGVGLLLLTLTARLGRIVDRTRLLAAERRLADPQARVTLDAQLAILGRRARFIRLAVALSASSVAMIGILITVLFVGLLLGWNVALAAALLFVASLLSLVAAMLVFVRELFQALTALGLTVDGPPA
ncbi:MAG: DUF2721 domain-containing protein [Gemmatimonadales bacterium]